MHFPAEIEFFLSHQLPNSHFVLMPHNDAQFGKVHLKEYFYFYAPSNLLQFEKETEKEMLKNIYYSCKNGILLSKMCKNFQSLEQFIQTVKGQNNFWLQIAFLTCSCRFLISIY